MAVTTERDVPADEDEIETPIKDADTDEGSDDDKRDVGLGTDEE
jgi:hypothetical protein